MIAAIQRLIAAKRVRACGQTVDCACRAEGPPSERRVGARGGVPCGDLCAEGWLAPVWLLPWLSFLEQLVFSYQRS